jgi:GNAT superfamily N-acetyltransferase
MTHDVPRRYSVAVEIRAVTFEDIEAMAEVAVRGWRWAYRGVISDETLDQLDIGARVRRLQENWKPERLCLVAVVDDRVVGFASESNPPQIPGFDSEIGGLYVDPDYARFGYGRELVKAMVRQFVDRGAQTMCIHTLKANRIGRSFYEKIGGVLVAEDTWNDYPAVWYAWPRLVEF